MNVNSHICGCFNAPFLSHALFFPKCLRIPSVWHQSHFWTKSNHLLSVLISPFLKVKSYKICSHLHLFWWSKHNHHVFSCLVVQPQERLGRQGSLAKLAAKAIRRKRWGDTKKMQNPLSKSKFRKKMNPVIQWSMNNYPTQRDKLTIPVSRESTKSWLQRGRWRQNLIPIYPDVWGF